MAAATQQLSIAVGSFLMRRIGPSCRLCDAALIGKLETNA